MPAKTVYNQDKIDFIKKIMRQKVRETRQYDTPACKLLASQVNLSYATLLKALNGEFTLRTVRRMMAAGWFSNGEYRRGQSDNASSWRTPPPGRAQRQRQSNDQTQQKAREDAAFRRGYNQGKTEGYNQGRQSRPSRSSDAQAYSRGYVDGLRDGQERARNSSSPSGFPMDRLQSLLNMTTSRGAAQGEVVAARKAVGKTLAKWIREKFGQNVDVQVQ